MAASLFRTTPPAQLNALQALRQNALYARQKNEGTSRSCRAITVVRYFVNNVSSTRYPRPLLANRTRPFRGNNSSVGTFMRAGARPHGDFSPSRRFVSFEKCFIAPIARSFFPLRFTPHRFAPADEKRSS